MQLNDLRVNLTLDNSGFRLSVAESGRILRQFEQSLGSTADQARRTEGVLSSFGESAHRSIQSLGLARFALMDLHDVFLSLPKAIMGSAGEIERLQKLMEGLSKETDATKRKLEAASNVQFVFGMAKNSPFEVKALTDTFVKLKTGGIDPTTGAMQALVDGVAKFGGSSESLKRASIAIQQMGGKGVISMEELRQQLGEAVPTAMAAMAVGMKMSMSELTNAVSKGTVSSTSAIKKMLAVMSVDNAGAAAGMMDTWTGMLERLKTQWELWKINAAGEGMFEGAKSGLADLIKQMGSPEAASFGRKVGESIGEAITSIIDLTKWMVSVGDEIKIAGELLLFYFAHGKLMPAVNAIKSYYDTMKEGSAKVRADLAMEAQGRRDQMVANAELLESTIARNNAEIESNQARVESARAARAEELADAIASNRAILGVYAARSTANQAAMTAALPSNSPAVSAVSRGVATAEQDLEAQVLLRHAEAAQVDQAEITRRTASLQAENIAMAEERTMLTTTTAAMTAESEARALSNAHLSTSATVFRQEAAAVTEANAAMALSRAAGATVVSAVSSMVFSMGGLLTAIMAVAWAWNTWSENAEKAAKNAEVAFNAKKRLEEGKYNEDTVKASQANIEKVKNDIKTEEFRKMSQEENGFDTSGTDDKIARLKSDLKIYQDNLVVEQKRVAQKVGEEAGHAMVSEYVDSVNRELAKSATNVNAISGKYTDLRAKQGGKLTDEQTKSEQQELFDARTSALSKSISMYDIETAKLQKAMDAQKLVLNGSKSTAEQIKAAQQEVIRLDAAINGIAKEKANAGNSLASMQAPNEFTAGKPKKPKKEQIDSVQRELASSKLALDKLETTLDGMGNQVIDIQAVRAGVDSHIDALIASDAEKNVAQKHTDQERDELAKALENKELLELLKKTYGDLAKRRQEVTDQFVLANQKMLTGNFDLQPKTKSELEVDTLKSTLEAMKKDTSVSGETIEAYKKALADAQAVLNGERTTKAIDAFGGNKKSIESLQAGNIVNDRARMQAQQALETEALRKKYESQMSGLKENDQMRLRLQAQFNQEDLLLAEKHANEMKTPLEKLADSWADVTSNMQKSTADWANKTIDAFMNLATTGKFEFGDLVKSILADILKIQMQAQMGAAVKSMATSVGNFASGLISGSKFADGGIMSSLGSLPLKKYSMGGVASTPQLALFGEGRMNEAYVPLPDGRSIPVTLKGGAGAAQTSAPPSVTVNVVNQSGTPVNADAGQMRFDGKGFILDVVMTAATTPGAFRSGMKQALK